MTSQDVQNTRAIRSHWLEQTSQLLRDRLGPSLEADGICAVSDLPLTAAALTALGLYREYGRTVVWVSDGARTCTDALENATTLAEELDIPLLHYPAREGLVHDRSSADAAVEGKRMRALARLAESQEPCVLVTDIQALMQETVPLSSLAATLRKVRILEQHEPRELLTHLDSHGYRIVPEVQNPEEAALRGGIIDVWPPTDEWPTRIEFFGDEVDSIRTFDPATQQSRGRVEEVSIVPAREAAGAADGGGALLAYLPENALYAWWDFARVCEHARVYEQLDAEDGAASEGLTFSEVYARIHGSPSTWEVGLASMGDPFGRPIDLSFGFVRTLTTPQADTYQPDLMDETRREYLNELRRHAEGGTDVAFLFRTEGTLERFREQYGPEWMGSDRLHAAVAPLTDGFTCAPIGWVVVTESDLYGHGRTRNMVWQRGGRSREAAKAAGPRIADWNDIEPGDLVVHASHGIGRYLGLYDITFHGQLQECFVIEYAEEAKVYVPVSQAHVLSFYMGVGDSRTRLHRLGDNRWNREKYAAERSVQDLASALLDTQAKRDSLEGHACGPDTPWQHEFEAAFPFTETPDQEQAIAEIKEDLESTRPMDRLICGDVGYGKTEVAMRAVFKMVMAGKQVAILVPTTVLAQQHFESFSERMAAFPIRVEMLSRFRTKGQQQAVIRDMKEGSVDVVIGTHALVQPTVEFADLGLLIIDEEQRFGVRHKEQLKQLRTLVDVLTLTATPIPRTLYMSLTGARDISTIQSPPRERRAVITEMLPNRDEDIRERIVRELKRDGQIFYLHFRVKSINRIRTRLEQLVPKARIAVGHGQMPARELRNVMHRFAQGEYDILLCTTIIESGVDIPNVNTIFIDRADRFGVADLYQLRGRVGRAGRQAYACLMLPEHGNVDPTARKRIRALMDHSELGAGFKLAMRDLEIRGAGNLLGTAQSGHIAAVGFSLYCQLLKRSVAIAKGTPLPPIIDVEVKLDFIRLTTNPAEATVAAVIPSGYIEDERLRVAAYRQIAECTSLKEVDGVRSGFRDRFGKLPASLDRLLLLASIRIRSAEKGVLSLETQEDKLIMSPGRDRYLQLDGRFPRLQRSDPMERLKEIRRWIERVDDDTGQLA